MFRTRARHNDVVVTTTRTRRRGCHNDAVGHRPKEFRIMARKGKVTVVGAGFYGSTTAQRLAEYDIFDEVVLTHIIEGKPEGLARDINQSRPGADFETKVNAQ